MLLEFIQGGNYEVDVRAGPLLAHPLLTNPEYSR